MTREHRTYLGKVDYIRSGRRNCKAEITWSLENGRFSMQAGIWDPCESDYYTCGQCVDTVAAFFPHNKRVQRMLAIWQEWHLNDMTAGSPAQNEWLKAHKNDENTKEWRQRDHYQWACHFLSEAGLNPDPNFIRNGKPYAYGSAWLTRELPADVITEIESW